MLTARALTSPVAGGDDGRGATPPSAAAAADAADAASRLDIAFIDADDALVEADERTCCGGDAGDGVLRVNGNSEGDAERTGVLSNGGDVIGHGTDARAAGADVNVSGCSVDVGVGRPEADMAPSPAVRTGGSVSPQPLKSALKSGSTRRRLQVVINESRNTYCEADYGPEEEATEVPRLVSVRAFHLSLPELLNFEPGCLSEAAQLSPASGYPEIISGDEPCQETAVDDSEGSESSTDGLEVGTAPLAKLDDLGDDIASSDSPPEDGSEPAQVTASPSHVAQPTSDIKESADATEEAAQMDEAKLEAIGSSELCGTSTAAGDGVSVVPPSSISSEEGSSPASSPTSPPTASAIWRHLPDLVTDGAPAGPVETSPESSPSPPAGSETASPPTSPQAPSSSSGSVLTIANVQQHDKVIAIEDSRAEGLLQGILKGGKLWAGTRSVSDSDDSELSQQRRSVRFTKQESEPAPVVVPLGPPPPVPTESDGDSSISSMDTVIAVTMGNTRRNEDAARLVSSASQCSGPTEDNVATPREDSVARTVPSPESARLRGQLHELTRAVISGKSNAEVARAIQHNALRRSLARGEPAQPRPSAVGAVPPPAMTADLSGSCPNLSLSSPEKMAPPSAEAAHCVRGLVGSPESRACRALFSPPPPDIHVPGDVREWKLSETLWPQQSPVPARRQAVQQSQKQPIERLDNLLAAASSPARPLSAAAADDCTPVRRPQPEPRRRSLNTPEKRAEISAVVSRSQQAPAQSVSPAHRPADASSIAPLPRKLFSPSKSGPAAQVSPDLTRTLEAESSAAGDRGSAASSAESRDSYSLDDIDEALVTERAPSNASESSRSPPWSPPPTGVKEGSADSGYGSNDGRAAEAEEHLPTATVPVADDPEELDELAAFANLQADRTERLRRRYHQPADCDAEGFARNASVRGIKPRFVATSEILRQMQQQAHPGWRQRDPRTSEVRRLPSVKEVPVAPAAGVGPRLTHQLPPPRPSSALQPAADHQRLRMVADSPAAHGAAAASPLPHGYVYPHYQPPRGPPLPPRHGQVRPTAQPAPVPPSRRDIYQSAPNLYQPTAAERRTTGAAPPAQPPLPPLSRTVSATLPTRPDQYLYSHPQQQQQQQQQLWYSGVTRAPAPEQRLHRGQHQRSLSGPHRPLELQHQVHQQQLRQHQLRQLSLQQQQLLMQRQPSDGAQLWGPAATAAHAQSGRGPPRHLVPTRPLSSAEMYAAPARELHALHPGHPGYPGHPGHFTPQPYVHDM